MRKKLGESEGVRKRFSAVFVRVGKKTNFNGYSEDTILLRNVTDIETGQVVSDHLWFTYSKRFEDANIREGNTIEFDARVKEYTKGYVNRQLKVDQRKQDFKLSHPTNVKVRG